MAWSTEALRIAFQLGAYATAEELEDPAIADAWDALVSTEGVLTMACDDWSALTYEVAGHVNYALPNCDADWDRDAEQWIRKGGWVANEDSGPARVYVESRFWRGT